MTESKIDLTDRLRREGRWAEASKFKDTARADFRAKGMKRDEAAEAAWAAMAAAYPPLPAPEPVPEPEPAPPGESAAVDDSGGMEVLPAWIDDAAPPDLTRDIKWVYQHLENKGARPEQAPSAGAWSLLVWARKYQSRFFEQLLPKALAAKPAEDEQKVRREKRRIEEIEAMLEKLEEDSKEELRADTPKVISEKVNFLVDDWGRQFGLTIPADAQADLAVDVGHLVKEAVDALATA